MAAPVSVWVWSEVGRYMNMLEM